MSLKPILLGLVPMSALTVYVGATRGAESFLDAQGLTIAVISLAILCFSTGTGRTLLNSLSIVLVNRDASEREILLCIRTIDMLFWVAFAGGVVGFFLASAMSIPTLGGIPDSWVKSTVTALLYGMVAAGFVFLPLKNSLEMHRLRDKINAF